MIPKKHAKYERPTPRDSHATNPTFARYAIHNTIYILTEGTQAVRYAALRAFKNVKNVINKSSQNVQKSQKSQFFQKTQK